MENHITADDLKLFSQINLSVSANVWFTDITPLVYRRSHCGLGHDYSDQIYLDITGWSINRVKCQFNLQQSFLYYNLDNSNRPLKYYKYCSRNVMFIHDNSALLLVAEINHIFWMTCLLFSSISNGGFSHHILNAKQFEIETHINF